MTNDERARFRRATTRRRADTRLLRRAMLVSVVALAVPVRVRAQTYATTDPRSRASDVDRSHPAAPAIEYRDDPGGPVPEGWTRVLVPIRGLYAAGAAVGPVSYLLGLLGTVVSCSTWQLDCRLGWIPVAGPIVLLAGGAARTDTGGMIATGVLAGFQVLAATSTIVGLTVWQPRLRRTLPASSLSLTSDGTSVSFTLRF